MATTVQLTPDVINQLTKMLTNAFGDVFESFAKEISQKAITVANKKTELVLNEMAKKGTFLNPIKKFFDKTEKGFKEQQGLFGLTKDFITSLKQPKPENNKDKEDKRVEKKKDDCLVM